jgi:hypothetical protein
VPNKSKVRQFDAAVAGHHHVLWFQVAVNELSRVQVSQASRYVQNSTQWIN